MAKTFYAKRKPPKIFYARTLHLRSTAYGAKVAADYLDWLEDFYGSWDQPSVNPLFSEQGDVGGSLVRTNVDFGMLRGLSTLSGEPIPSSSVLPALYFGGLFLEVEKSGQLFVNREKTGVNLGGELKAWAASSYPDGAGLRLFVVGKPLASQEMRLCEYRFSGGGFVAGKSVILGGSLSQKSRLVCFGRHLFLVHDGCLLYYYLSPETDELERVGIGADDPCPDWCMKVHHPVVGDRKGRVYWASGGAVYTFPIGSPHRLEKLPFGGTEVYALYCRGDTVFVHGANLHEPVCEAFYIAGGGWKRTELRPSPSMVLSRNGELYDFLRWRKGGGKLLITAGSTDGKAEQISSTLELPAADRVYYFFGNLLADVRYAGYEGKKKIICLKG